MKRPSKAGSKAAKTPRREATTPKRTSSAKATPSRFSSATSQEAEIARLKRERDEALEQQSAATEVLRVISSSPGDLGPVFHAMLKNAVRICGAKFGFMFGHNGEAFHMTALLG